MKKFKWKDKTGRGFSTNNLTVEDLLKWDNTESYDGELLHDFIQDAQEDDKWEDRANIIICTHV